VKRRVVFRKKHWTDNRDDPGGYKAVKARKAERAGTDPESEAIQERKLWWGAALLGMIFAFLAGRS
jgi:hypothetical protein